MDQSSVVRYHWLLTTLGAMGVLIDGYDLSVISFTILLISPIFGISSTSSPFLYGTVLASGLIGMAIGGITFGWLADKLGRKTMFVVDLILFVVFAILSSVAQNVFEVILFRILLGIGIGADYPISSTLISEFAPAKRRGMLLMFGIMFYWIGAMLAFAVSLLALRFGADLAWRIPLLAGGIIAIPVVIARNITAESPRWLLQRNRVEKAKRIVEEKLGIDIGQVSRYKEHTIGELFTKYVRNTTFVLVAWFAFDVGAYGLGFYTSTLYKQLGIGNLEEIAIFGAVSSLFPILAYVSSMFMVDRYGRKMMTLIGFISMIIILGLLPPLTSINAYLLLPLWILYSSLEQWPGGALSFAYSVELFPTSLRGLAQGLSTTVSRIGGIIGVILFPYISKYYGLQLGTFFFIGFLALAVVVTLLLAPETMAKSLEEITEK